MPTLYQILRFPPCFPPTQSRNKESVPLLSLKFSTKILYKILITRKYKGSFNQTNLEDAIVRVWNIKTLYNLWQQYINAINKTICVLSELLWKKHKKSDSNKLISKQHRFCNQCITRMAQMDTGIHELEKWRIIVVLARHAVRARGQISTQCQREIRLRDRTDLS